ncbi:glutathione S-transferase [Auriculariales sp. MPI-PUGE-AT-0066]|nr:glutathione S-transferase [Auriculariales sp. MPI-PUGE-AT-0066]
MDQKALKPINIWTTSSGPNGWKPLIILEELGIPYTVTGLTFAQLIAPEFKKLNPGGKVPVMLDPNTDLLLWESGAIMMYLVDQYDTAKKLTYTSLKENSLLNQWLMFQMSQQGPMYGQVGWFNVMHPEKLPSVIERYTEQAHRILRILNGALEGKQWLVGDKCTFADLGFFMWHIVLPLSMGFELGKTPLAEHPNVLAWHERMAARASCKKIIAIRQAQMDAEGLGTNALPTNMSVDEMVKHLAESEKQA